MALFPCPSCSWRVKITEQDLGKKGKCVQCGHELVFPRSLTAPAKEAAAAPEKPVAARVPSGESGAPPWLKWVGLAAVILLVGGIGVVLALSARGSPKATVVGKVTYNKKPLSSGSITFFGADGISTPASIGSDGSFEAKDCPLGSLKVAVRSMSTSLQKREGDKIKWVTKSMIPSKYSDPERSGLTCIVGGSRQEIMIDLEN
jgi:hypothetical protein